MMHSAYCDNCKSIMIDLDSKYVNEVKRILRRHVPHCEVLAYGSRVSGSARRYSDLNLAIIADESLDWRELDALRDAFAHSDLPIIVDVVDWNALTPQSRKLIERDTEVIQRPEP